MTRLRLVIAYDGSPFKGWQSQADGNTVQDHCEAAFAKVCGQRVAVCASGRTDAGVHALAQCAHADVPSGRLSTAQWLVALNAHLPPKIRIMRCTRASAEFHARFSAKGKIYSYRIWNGPVMPPLENGRAWHLPGPLDTVVLSSCATKITGTHDFKAFAANRGKPSEDTVRTIRRVGIRRQGALITLTFEGDGFLYKMVRLITGSLVRCAQHRAEPRWMDDLLAGKTKTSFAAPAEGLYLARVRY
jgi:tRNA pseudouridine38-40 synthase